MPPRARPGFTLIELLIAIGIISILTAVAFVTVNPAQRIEDAEDARDLVTTRSVNQAIKIAEVEGIDVEAMDGVKAQPGEWFKIGTTDCEGQAEDIEIAGCADLSELVEAGYLGPVSPDSVNESLLIQYDGQQFEVQTANLHAAASSASSRSSSRSSSSSYSSSNSSAAQASSTSQASSASTSSAPPTDFAVAVTGQTQFALGPAADGAGNTITYSLDLPPQHGTVTIAGNQATYTPDAGYEGDDPFTFMRSDLGNIAGSDESFQYDLDVNAGGAQGPTITYEGVTLMQPSTRPIYQTVSGGNGAQVTRTVTPRPGGVDLTYTVTNPTGTPQKHPTLLVPGLMLPTDSGALLPSDIGEIQATTMRPPRPPWNSLQVRMTDQSGQTCVMPNGNACLVRRTGVYPEESYSPMVVVTTRQYALGISVLYDFKGTWTSVGSVLYTESDGSWIFSVNHFSQNLYDATSAGRLSLNPGETRTYVVALRFAPPRDWVLTMKPYRDHFRAMWNVADASVNDRDRRPIRTFVLGSWYNNSLTPISTYLPNCPFLSDGCPAMGVEPSCYDPPREIPPAYRNERGFDGTIWQLMTSDATEPDGVRWRPVLDWFMNRTRDFGFRRTLIWALAGNYPMYDLCDARNYPPVMATVWAPELEDDRQDFIDVANENTDVNLGYYWGRTSQVPVFDENGDWEWDSENQAIDLDDPDHLNFVREEYQAMLALGMDELGLDAPSNIPSDQKYAWWSEMMAQKPDLKMISENPASDWTNLFAANWGHANAGSSWYYGGGPNNIAWYLNPRAEQIMWDVGLSTNPTQQQIDSLKEIMRWGYTPAIGAHINVNLETQNVSQESLPMTVCYNGISATTSCTATPVRNTLPIMVTVEVE